VFPLPVFLTCLDDATGLPRAPPATFPYATITLPAACHEREEEACFSPAGHSTPISAGESPHLCPLGHTVPLPCRPHHTAGASPCPLLHPPASWRRGRTFAYAATWPAPAGPHTGFFTWEFVHTCSLPVLSAVPGPYPALLLHCSTPAHLHYTFTLLHLSHGYTHCIAHCRCCPWWATVGVSPALLRTPACCLPHTTCHHSLNLPPTCMGWSRSFLMEADPGPLTWA